MSLKETAATPVHIVATLSASAGQEQALLQALRNLVAASQAEPGCIQYILHVDTANAGVFVIYETWTNQVELDQHMAMPHFLAFVATSESLLGEPPHLRFLQPI